MRFVRCKKCEDRGYTYIQPKMGIMVACTECEKGEQMERLMEEKRDEVRIAKRRGFVPINADRELE